MESNRWVECRPELIVTNNGVLGRGAAHTVWFANNANSYSALQVRQASGQSIKAHVLGIFYRDNSTGTNILLSGLKDSTVQVIGTNWVVYPDAFSDIKAAIRYTYSSAGLMQDVILRERPVAPEDLGLNPASTHLFVATELIDSPTPQIESHTWPSGTEVMEDQTLDFGSMRMIQGRAFALRTANRRQGVAVAKQYVVLNDGRKVVLERVRYPSIKRELLKLPLAGTTTNAAVSGPKRWFAQGTLPRSTEAARSGHRALPVQVGRTVLSPPPQARAASAAPQAKDPPPAPLKSPKAAQAAARAVHEVTALDEKSGLVLDWELIEGGAGWFDAPYDGVTWVVSGECHLSSAYFLGGQGVIKYQPGSSLYLDGPLWYYASSTILTSACDDGYGEAVPCGATNSDWTYGPALALNPQDVQTARDHMTVFYANPGIIPNVPVSTVSVTATDPMATKGASDTGTFTITRVDGDWSKPLTVHFTLSGTAANGTDYDTPSATQATIAAGAESAAVTITPRSPSGLAWERTATLTLQSDPNGAYVVDEPSADTVYIYDDSLVPPLAVSAPPGLVAW